jgi:hypothetical protein
VNQPAGWYTDPFNREQQRYWDGRFWTMHDRPPEPDDQTPPPGFGEPGSAQPTRPTSYGEGAPPTSPGFGLEPQGRETEWSPRPDRRRAMLAGGIAAAVIVIGAAVGVGAYVVAGHGPAAASVAVADAVTQSLNEQSADMSLDIQVSADGQNEQIAGDGRFNFANHSGTMTITVPTGGSQLSEQVIEDGTTVFVSLPSSLGQVLPGKSWVSMDATTFTSGNTGLGSGFNGIDDPSALLHQLQSQGDSVTSLGATTFNGTSATEYSVTIPFSQLEQALGQLPAQDRQMVSGMLPSSVTETIYIDDNGLLGGVLVPFTMSFGGHSLSESFEMSLSNYGTPVSVTPPPASEVATLQQFEAAAGMSGGGSGVSTISATLPTPAPWAGSATPGSAD